MKEVRCMKIGVVTFPISKAGNTPVSNLIDIMYSLSSEVHLITGNEGSIFSKKNDSVHVYLIKHVGGTNIFTRIMGYIYTQLNISHHLVKMTGHVDFWVFFIGGEGLLLPMLAALLLRKKVTLVLAGFPARGSLVQKDVFSKPISFLSNINLALSTKIIVYSKIIIQERGLEKYGNKISIACEHIINLDEFRINKQIIDREKNVGYIGTISKIKGVPNLMQAIPNILNEDNRIEFIIGGDGDAFNETEEFISENRLNDSVKLPGWIPHNHLPEYLNELKLLVLPSYTEGLPNIVLEAMACGTPVLATPVAAVPDIIKDGETGFIMANNSPECIAKNVTRALEHPNLETIVENAKELVERKFTYEAAVNRWKKILEGL